ncbi:MAG: UDP-N-acetylglucosamine 2-epimerase [Promethearchaeota archaeon]
MAGEKKRKILVFLGSRAHYSSLISIMRHIIDSDMLELILISGASAILNKYGEVVNLIEKDGFHVNDKVYMIIEGETPETMAKSTGLGIIELSGIIKKYNPDFTLLIADRYETLAAAIASAYNNVPIAHVQGGEVTGSIDESIRHAITKFAHIHFPANELAKERILQMGEDENYVFNVGCPRIDTVKDILQRPYKKERINNFITKEGVGDIFDIDNNFLLAAQHPVTTEYGQGIQQISETLRSLKEISQERDLPIIMLWPNADAGSDNVAKGIRTFRESNFPWQSPNEKPDKNFHFFKNLPFEIYIQLMDKTLCLIGNSSSGIREGEYIGTPVVNIGTRQSNRARGINVIDVNHDHGEIKEAIEKQIDHGKYKSKHIYGNGHAGKKITQILETIDVNVQKHFRTHKLA